jgi:hypothetical protein
VRLVPLDRKAPPARLVLKVQKAIPERRGRREQLVQLARLALIALSPGPKAPKVHKETQVPKASKVFRV